MLAKENSYTAKIQLPKLHFQDVIFDFLFSVNNLQLKA